MSKERRISADRYKNEEDKIRCIVAGKLLQYSVFEKMISDSGALSGAVEDKKAFLKNDLETDKNQYGKPFVKGSENFQFNISHSGNWVVLGYSSKPIGVDIERIRHDEEIKKIAKRYFTPNEISFVFEKEEYIPQRFAEIWTGKESYLKYLGTGIRKALNSFDVLELKKKGLFGERFHDEYYLSCFPTEDAPEICVIEYDDLIGAKG